jgi:hypothetical protein
VCSEGEEIYIPMEGDVDKMEGEFCTSKNQKFDKEFQNEMLMPSLLSESQPPVQSAVEIWAQTNL